MLNWTVIVAGLGIYELGNTYRAIKRLYPGYHKYPTGLLTKIKQWIDTSVEKAVTGRE